MTKLLFKQAKTSISGAWFTAAFAVFLLWEEQSKIFLSGWFTLYSAIMFARFLLYLKYRQQSAATIQNYLRWRTNFIWMAGFSGVLWGLLVIILFPVGTLESKVVMILFAGGLTASAIASYAAVLQASLAFSLPFLGSIIFIGILHPDKFNFMVSSMTLLYTLVLIITAKYMNSSVVHATTLQFENLDLINHLRESREQQRSLNFRLQDEIDFRKSVQLDLEQSLQTLEVAKNAAEQANKAKSRFLAVISHEIRTPLNNIIMAAECLGKTALTKDMQHYNDIAATAGRNLLIIINDILDHAKIGSGQMHLERIHFNLTEYLKKICLAFEVSARAKGIKIRYNFSANLPANIKHDPFRLRQVLVNLLDNALKFTDHGVVSLVVRMTETDNNCGELLFSVTDTGIGITADNLDQLFEPFVQADASTTRCYGGTGLGLSICKDIVTLMGGRIWVDSSIGQGSTFHFTLPLSADVQMGSLAAGAEDHLGQPAAKGFQLRILLADDDEMSRVLTTTLLEQQGHQVTAVADGEKALDEALTRRYDIMLLDMEMPKMDGLKVITQIRKKAPGSGSHLPIAAVTAQAFPEDRARCFAAGTDGYLAKPVTEKKLLNLLTETLEAAARKNKPQAKPASRLSSPAVIRRTRGNPDILKKMVQIFVTNYPQLREQMGTAMVAGKSETVRHTAHKLKGMIAFFDQQDLLHQAQALEHAGQEQDLAAAGDLWQILQSRTDQFHRELIKTIEL